MLAGLVLLSSWITGAHHNAWLIFVFLVETGFHHTSQAGGTAILKLIFFAFCFCQGCVCVCVCVCARTHVCVHLCVCSPAEHNHEPPVLVKLLVMPNCT